MIHDAEVEVTCDAESCQGSVIVDLHWKYHTADESSGFYESGDEAVEETLVADYEWIVRDGKHFCGEECARVGSA